MIARTRQECPRCGAPMSPSGRDVWKCAGPNGCGVRMALDGPEPVTSRPADMKSVAGDRERAASDVLDAITEPGPAPHVHREAGRVLAAHWPTLFHALRRMARAYDRPLPRDFGR